MGESIEEATITKWIKKIGDSVSLDEPIVEIATDKVDTDVTSEVEGIILEQKFNENDVVQIGEVLAIIETDSEIPTKNSSNNNIQEPSDETNNEETKMDLDVNPNKDPPVPEEIKTKSLSSSSGHSEEISAVTLTEDQRRAKRKKRRDQRE